MYAAHMHKQTVTDKAEGDDRSFGHSFLQQIAGLLLLLLLLGQGLKCVLVLVHNNALSEIICCRHCIWGVHTRTGRSWDTETKHKE